MVTISEARSQIESARQQLAEQKRVAEENLRLIAEQRKKLPLETSQRVLRQQFSGLKGREQRRTISGLKSDLSNKEGLINQAQAELTGYGGEVNSYEQNLNKYEAEVQAIAEQQSALESVQKADDKGMLWAVAMYGEGLEKEYAQKWLKLQNMEREAWRNEVNSLQASLPSTEKLIIDYDKFKISGVESGEFGGSMSIKAYNDKIAQLQKNMPTITDKVKFDVPSLKVTEPPKTSIFSNDMFPMVSASMTGDIVRTTSDIKTGREGYKDFMKGKNMISGTGEYFLEKFQGGATNLLSGMKYSPFTYGEASGIVSGLGKVSAIPITLVKGGEFVVKQGTEAVGDFFKPIDTTKLNTKVYSQDFNMFYSPSKSGGTASFTPLTYEDIKQRQDLDKLGKVNQFIFGSDRASDTLLLANTRDLQRRYTGISGTNERINSLSLQLDNLSRGKIDSNNKWIGTNEEYQAYQNKYNEYEREVERQKGYGTGTVKVGFFGSTLDTPIQDIRALKKAESNPFTFFSSTVGETAGGFLGGLGKKLPEKKFTLFAEGKSGGFKEVKILGGTNAGQTKMEWFGEERINPKVETPTLSLIGEKVGQNVGRVSPYFIGGGVGTSLFFGEQFERFGNVVLENKGISNKDALKMWFSESPIESTIALGIPAFRLAKGTKNFAFTPREKLFYETLENKIPSAGQITMSKAEVIGVTDKGLVTSRQFTGKGIAENVRQGSRRYFSTRFQDWFGLKPTYAGRYQGDILFRNNLLTGTEKAIKISSKEAQQGYKEILEQLKKRGFTEKEAREYMKRTSAERRGYATSFGGEIISGTGNPLISIRGERLSRGVQENIYLSPTNRIIIQSPTRVGKLKQEEVSTLLEEFKTVTPRGKETGEIGELSFFRGSSEEYVPFKTRTFNEGAIAKKTGEKSYQPLGTVEQYKTAGLSQETTFGKPNKLSYSKADVTVINPTIQKETVFDFIGGTKTVKVKPDVFSEEWVKVSEEQLPFRTGVANFVKPASITKTPFSKTFGENGQATKQIFESRPITKEAKQQLVSDVSNILKPKQLPKQTARELIESNYPKMVGGTGTVTENVFMGSSVGFEDVGQRTMPDVRMNVLSGVTNKEQQSIKNDLGLNAGVGNMEKIDTGLKYKTGEIFRTNETQRPLEQLKINEMLKTQQQMKVEQAQKTTQRTTQKTQQKTNKPTPPKPKIKIIPPFSSLAKRVYNKMKEQPDIFESYGVRFGSEKSLGKFGSKGEAEQSLKKFLKGSLGASGGLKKGGMKLKATELSSFGGGEFKLSKTSPYKIIQKEKYRLTKGDEQVREINLFKKRGKKKSKKSGWLDW